MFRNQGEKPQGSLSPPLTVGFGTQQEVCYDLCCILFYFSGHFVG